MLPLAERRCTCNPRTMPHRPRKRYELEPYIETFADFEAARGLDVLEIGVGLGADHQRYAEAGARLTGVDLTERAVAHTRQRLAALNLDRSCGQRTPRISLSGMPALTRSIRGVCCTIRPNTRKRSRKSGGYCAVEERTHHDLSQVQHRGIHAVDAVRALGRTPGRTLADIYANYFESPGTKAYSVEEARDLFALFSTVEIGTVLTHGDLLVSAAGQRHRGSSLTIARALWPRWLIRRLLPRHGLFMLIKATK